MLSFGLLAISSTPALRAIGLTTGDRHLAQPPARADDPRAAARAAKGDRVITRDELRRRLLVAKYPRRREADLRARPITTLSSWKTVRPAADRELTAQPRRTRPRLWSVPLAVAPERPTRSSLASRTPARRPASARVRRLGDLPLLRLALLARGQGHMDRIPARPLRSTSRSRAVSRCIIKQAHVI